MSDPHAQHNGDNVSGNKIMGDAVGGDKYEVGTIQGKNVAVGPSGHAGDTIVIGQLIFQLPRRPGAPTAEEIATGRALLAELPVDSVPEQQGLPPTHRFFLPRNPNFVGREDELRRIAQALKGGAAAAITTGIGGIGKSQLASEFAHRYGRYFAGGVFWIRFAIPSNIPSEVAACGGPGCLDLFQDSDGLTLDEQMARVRQAFASDLPRLVIFDNCDDSEGATGEELLQRWRPTTGGCRVLVTARRQSWRGSAQLAIVGLPVLPRAESVALLRAHRVDLSEAWADAFAELLGDLPLALHLAGSFLETYRDEPFGGP